MGRDTAHENMLERARKEKSRQKNHDDDDDKKTTKRHTKYDKHDEPKIIRHHSKGELAHMEARQQKHEAHHDHDDKDNLLKAASRTIGKFFSGGFSRDENNSERLGKAYADAPSNWGKATGEAIERAKRGEVVYQEQKHIDVPGVKYGKSFGTITFKGDDGKIHQLKGLTGGLGNGAHPAVFAGSESRDPISGVFIGELKMSAKNWAKSTGSYVYEITDPKGTGRGNMPMHPDVASSGPNNGFGASFGCPNFLRRDEKKVATALDPRLKEEGDLPYKFLPSTDRAVIAMVDRHEKVYARNHDKDNHHERISEAAEKARKHAPRNASLSEGDFQRPEVRAEHSHQRGEHGRKA